MLGALLHHYGEQNWWPADSALEVVAGTILVQNTAWANAERALLNLRRGRVFTLPALLNTTTEHLEKLVRPAGFYRAKARTLKSLAAFVQRRYGGSLRRALQTPTAILRSQLLGLHGIGPETADAILLYAGGHEVFVADAYARRVLERHGIKAGSAEDVKKALVGGVERLQGIEWHGRNPRHRPSRMSRRRVSATAKLYQEAHAVLVRVGVEYCRPQPRCELCPLRQFLPRSPSPKDTQADTETEKRDANPV